MQLSKSERRAERLKALRPELAASVPDSISATDAIKIGGYETGAEMNQDLSSREAIARTAARFSAPKQKAAKSRAAKGKPPKGN